MLQRFTRFAFVALLLAPAAITAGALALSLPAAAEDPAPKGDVKITWYGQACFELDFPTGLVVLVDPYNDGIGTYKFPRHVKPDLVTISHEHADHNNDKGVSGSPKVLRGLTSADPKTQDWNKHDLVLKGVHIRSVPVYHDDKLGASRGKNTAFVFEPENSLSFQTIVHLGDLGHTLTDEQKAAIGKVGVVLIPVGGHFTIDALEAKKVADQLVPNDGWVIPMHYKTPALKPELPLAPATAFLAEFKDHVKKIDGNLWQTPEVVTHRVAQPTEAIDLGYEPAKADSKKKENDDVTKVADELTGKVDFTDPRAWTNAMPGGGSPTLHVAFEMEATAGKRSGGATVTVAAAVEIDGKNVPVELEEDGGAAIPKGGYPVAAGKTATIKLVAKDGQKGPGQGRVRVTAVLTPTKPEQTVAGPENAATWITIQDVR